MFLLILGVIILIGSFLSKYILNEYSRLKTIVPIIGFMIALAMIIGSCISYVPTGYTGILVTFGRVEENTLDAGIAFHLPWQNVVKMDNREQRDAFQLEAFSKDIQ